MVQKSGCRRQIVNNTWAMNKKLSIRAKFFVCRILISRAVQGMAWHGMCLGAQIRRSNKHEHGWSTFIVKTIVEQIERLFYSCLVVLSHFPFSRCYSSSILYFDYFVGLFALASFALLCIAQWRWGLSQIWNGFLWAEIVKCLTNSRLLSLKCSMGEFRAWSNTFSVIPSRAQAFLQRFTIWITKVKTCSSWFKEGWVQNGTESVYITWNIFVQLL